MKYSKLIVVVPLTKFYYRHLLTGLIHTCTIYDKFTFAENWAWKGRNWVQILLTYVEGLWGIGNRGFNIKICNLESYHVFMFINWHLECPWVNKSTKFWSDTKKELKKLKKKTAYDQSPNTTGHNSSRKCLLLSNVRTNSVKILQILKNKTSVHKKEEYT